MTSLLSGLSGEMGGVQTGLYVMSVAENVADFKSSNSWSCHLVLH